MSSLTRISLIAFLSLFFFSTIYSQESQVDKEIDEAYRNAFTGNYEQAIPVLKKYSEQKGFDDSQHLSINIVLNWSYLATKKDSVDVDKVNSLSDAYFAKYGISKNDTVKSKGEIFLLIMLGSINDKVCNYEKMVSYYSLAKKHYEEYQLTYNVPYSALLQLLAQGYINLNDYELAFDTGEKAWEVNSKLFGEINEASLKILDILYTCSIKNNIVEKSIEYVLKYAEISKELYGEKNTKYISSLVSLYQLYSKLGETQKALEINLSVVELEKEVLGEKHPDYLTSLSYLGLIYNNLGDFHKALVIFQKVVELAEELLGEKHPDYLTSLDNLSSGYLRLGEYQKALEINMKVVELRKEILGEKHPDYLTSLSNQALIYSGLGDYQKALEINLHVVELGKDVLGEKHPYYITSLGNLANDYLYLGSLHEALEIQLKVVEIGKDVLGEKHPDYLKYLNNLAQVYSDLGDYQKALEIDLKVVELYKEVLSEKHPYYLTSLGNLAKEYLNLGSLNKALEIQLKVVEIGKEVLDEKHPDYLRSINNLAQVYSHLGNYQKALEIDLQVVELYKEVLGEKHPDYLMILNNLANDYLYLGNYPKALEISLNVIKLRKEVLGEKHTDYFMSLNNLAQVYSYLGDYKKSLITILESVEICKTSLGEKHPDYLTSLKNLALAYSALGDFSTAMEIDLKVVELFKEVLDERHPKYLSSLSCLASDYSDIGDYPKALEIYLKVEEISKEVLGEKHPDYLECLSNLAYGYSDIGNNNEALEKYKTVAELRKEVLGEKHQDYLTSLNNLALTEFELSLFDSALYHKIYVTREFQTRMIEYFSILTENQREFFLNEYSYLFRFSTLFVEKASLLNPESGCFVYDLSLFSKGLLLNTNIDFEKLIAEKGTSEAKAKFDEMKLRKLEIQRISEKPISERFLNLDSLINIVQQKETELIKLSKEYGDYTRNLKITWKDVQENLNDNDVAIEFVEYPTLSDTIKYAALVLRKGWQYPKMISLFRKDQIDEYLSQNENEIYSNGFVGKQVKKLIWEPLEEVISLGERIYFSPAGIIHQLALENLSVDDSTTLGDQYQMYRLSSTKELVFDNPVSPIRSSVLFGGLEYAMEDADMKKESKKYEFEKNRSYLAFRGNNNDTTKRSGWEYLKGTKPEVEQISQLMREKQYKVKEFTGISGNEESFKSLSGEPHGIIHIATHGFFLPIEESLENPFIMQRAGDQQQDKPFIDPMLRSGLIMSGGNRAWLGEKIPENVEDGVLTAKEISHLDLRGTDLVVLSACETGLGEVSSEGVFGLQRSFKQAGVNTLVMSLWEVNDDATKFMMTEFYSNLAAGDDKRKAFLEAKQKCREKFKEPSYWAGFIMLN